MEANRSNPFGAFMTIAENDRNNAAVHDLLPGLFRAMVLRPVDHNEEHSRRDPTINEPRGIIVLENVNFGSNNSSNSARVNQPLIFGPGTEYYNQQNAINNENAALRDLLEPIKQIALRMRQLDQTNKVAATNGAYNDWLQINDERVTKRRTNVSRLSRVHNRLLYNKIQRLQHLTFNSLTPGFLYRSWHTLESPDMPRSCWQRIELSENSMASHNGVSEAPLTCQFCGIQLPRRLYTLADENLEAVSTTGCCTRVLPDQTDLKKCTSCRAHIDFTDSNCCQHYQNDDFSQHLQIHAFESDNKDNGIVTAEKENPPTFGSSFMKIIQQMLLSMEEDTPLYEKPDVEVEEVRRCGMTNEGCICCSGCMKAQPTFQTTEGYKTVQDIGIQFPGLPGYAPFVIEKQPLQRQSYEIIMAIDVGCGVDSEAMDNELQLPKHMKDAAILFRGPTNEPRSIESMCNVCCGHSSSGNSTSKEKTTEELCPCGCGYFMDSEDEISVQPKQEKTRYDPVNSKILRNKRSEICAFCTCTDLPNMEKVINTGKIVGQLGKNPYGYREKGAGEGLTDNRDSSKMETRSWKMKHDKTEARIKLEEEARELQKKIDFYKKENERFRKLINNCSCQNENCEQDLMSQLPPIRATHSGLATAIELLQSKCHSKDGMIAALAEGLRGAVNYAQIAKNLAAPCLEFTYWDFDRCALYTYLRRISSYSSKIRSNKMESKNASETPSKKIDKRSLQASSAVPVPSEFKIICEICRCLLVSWNTPENISTISGYQIFVNGKLTSNVRSPTRTEAILEAVDITLPAEFTLRAVHKTGKLSDPVTTVYPTADD